jgi:hypothetical protein
MRGAAAALPGRSIDVVCSLAELNRINRANSDRSVTSNLGCEAVNGPLCQLPPSAPVHS